MPPDTTVVDLPAPRGPMRALVTEPPGGQRRRVVLVPGFTGSKEDFLLLLPLLAADGHPAVAVDQRGQYESPGLDDPDAYTVEALAQELRAVVRRLAGADGVHLVGHSFGGLVCRRLVLDDAAGVASLTLLGSGPAAIGGPRAQAIRLLRPLLTQQGPQAVWAAAQSLQAGNGRREHPPDVEDFLRERFLASHQVGLLAMADALLAEPDRVDALARTRLPVLVTHGADDDAWTPDEQQAMARRLNARYAVVPGAAHSPATEAPGGTAAVLREFFRSVDG